MLVELLHVRGLTQERDFFGLGLGLARPPAGAHGGTGGADRAELEEIATGRRAIRAVVARHVSLSWKTDVAFGPFDARHDLPER